MLCWMRTRSWPPSLPRPIPAATPPTWTRWSSSWEWRGVARRLPRPFRPCTPLWTRLDAKCSRRLSASWGRRLRRVGGRRWRSGSWRMRMRWRSWRCRRRSLAVCCRCSRRGSLLPSSEKLLVGGGDALWMGGFELSYFCFERIAFEINQRYLTSVFFYLFVLRGNYWRHYRL